MSDETEKPAVLLQIGLNAMSALSVDVTENTSAARPVGSTAEQPFIRVSVAEVAMDPSFEDLKRTNAFPGGRTYAQWVELVAFSYAVEYTKAALKDMEAKLDRLKGPGTIVQPLNAPTDGGAPPKAQA